MMTEKYNELVEAFQSRPSRSEDIQMIRQLQKENQIREQEVMKMNEKVKSFYHEPAKKDTVIAKVSSAQSLMQTSERGRIMDKVISVNDFAIIFC